MISTQRPLHVWLSTPKQPVFSLRRPLRGLPLGPTAPSTILAFQTCRRRALGRNSACLTQLVEPSIFAEVNPDRGTRQPKLNLAVKRSFNRSDFVKGTSRRKDYYGQPLGGLLPGSC